MVQDQSLNSVFHALADPTRRAMLRDLAHGERIIGALAAPYDMSFPAASKHVRVLEQAGLLKREVRGRAHMLSIEPKAVRAARDWFGFYEAFWTEKFDALDAVLKSNRKAKKK